MLKVFLKKNKEKKRNDKALEKEMYMSAKITERKQKHIDLNN